MKFLILGLTLFVSSLSNATDFKCIVTDPVVEGGMLFHIWYELETDVNDPTKISKIVFESLADNGFYGKFEPGGSYSGKFLDQKSLSFRALPDPASPPEDALVFTSVYKPNPGNYVGKVTTKNKSFNMKCMELKGL